MRLTARILSFAALAFVPAGLFAQAVYFKNGNREERWEINDPFSTKAPDAKKAVWKTDELTLTTRGAELTRKASAIVRVDWAEPPLLLKAREQVERGEAANALQTIEPLLFKFDKLRKTPGSPWLKSAEVKLDALAQLSNTTALKLFINVLEENDDGTIPGLAAKLKLARLAIKVRDGDNTGVLTESEKLLGELEEPETRARLFIFKADALLALRRYEESLNTYLQVPVFYGSAKAFIPVAYLGAAKTLRAMDSPSTHAQRLDLAAIAYLRDVVRDFPLSKEAQAAKALLPRDERVAEDKRVLSGENTSKGDTAEKPAGDAAEKSDDKPAADDKEKPADAPAEKPAGE